MQVLDDKTKELFSFLDKLQSDRAAEEATRAKDFQGFSELEGKLIEAGNKLSGPSPAFQAPTWEGSDDPQTASYKAAFEPVIRAALSELSAADEEARVRAAELVVSLRQVFGQTADDLGVFSATPGTGGGATDNETLILEWVADSIINSASIINSGLQIAIQNALIKKVVASTASDLAGWIAKKFDALWQDTLVPVIESVLAAQADSLDVVKETERILKLLQLSFARLSPEQTKDEESVRAWIQDAILGSSLLPELGDEKKEELVGNLEDVITQLFPQPDQITFYTTFQGMLEQQLYDPDPVVSAAGQPQGGAASGAGSGGVDPTVADAQQQLKALTDTLPQAQTDAQTAQQKLTAADAAGTISRSDRNKLVVDARRKQEKLSALQVQIDKAKLKLQQAQTDAAVAPLRDQLMKDQLTAAQQRVNDLTDELSSAEDEDRPGLERDLEEATNDLAALLDAAEATNAGAAAASQVIGGGLKGLIASIAAQFRVDAATQSDWESKAREIVHQGVALAFDALSEQGTQGRLIATSYDYQTVKRIAESSKVALQQLSQDLDKDVPKNAETTLAAAKAITSASISLQEFSTSLQAVTAQFKADSGLGAGASGRGSVLKQKVSDLVNGGQSIRNEYQDGDGDLGRVGQKLYLSSRPPAPIRVAEVQGVRLAADAAGFSTRLNKLLIQEQQEAVTQLTALGDSYVKVFDDDLTAFKDAANQFFDALGGYVDKRFSLETEKTDLEGFEVALTELGDLMTDGVANPLSGALRTN